MSEMLSPAQQAEQALLEMDKRNEQQKAANRGKYLTTWKEPDGQSIVRVLDRLAEDEPWFILYVKHFSIQLDGKGWAYCLKPGECEPCLRHAKWEIGTSDEQGKAKLIKPKDRAAFYIVAKEIDEETKQEVWREYIWEVGAKDGKNYTSPFRRLMQLIRDPENGNILSMGPDGRNLKINKSGSGLDTKLSIDVAVNQSPCPPFNKAKFRPMSKLVQEGRLTNADLIDIMEGRRKCFEDKPDGVAPAAGKPTEDMPY